MKYLTLVCLFLGAVVAQRNLGDMCGANAQCGSGCCYLGTCRASNENCHGAVKSLLSGLVTDINSHVLESANPE